MGVCNLFFVLQDLIEIYFFLLGFTPCKDEQPLEKEKETQKD